jgi:hypothetical protein
MQQIAFRVADGGHHHLHTRSVAAWEALVPFFDDGCVSVARELPSDVIVPLKRQSGSFIQCGGPEGKGKQL